MEARLTVARRTYIFVGPPGSAAIVMSAVEAVLNRSFIREPGTDPYIRADSVAVYVGAHDFDDGDIDGPDETPLALQTGYPLLVDVRDTDRNVARQQDAAARIFAAIKADARLKAVLVDDMQHVVGITDGA
ncbi:MAG TPA: hypothetical protein VME44_10640 [Streptosporangiaceae bacterium]|nr:hypothetical protein [Streptosporangiaceae bacterium]